MSSFVKIPISSNGNESDDEHTTLNGFIREGYFGSFRTRMLPPDSPPCPLPFCISNFSKKVYPFHIPFCQKRYPFHIPFRKIIPFYTKTQKFEQLVSQRVVSDVTQKYKSFELRIFPFILGTAERTLLDAEKQTAVDKCATAAEGNVVLERYLPALNVNLLDTRGFWGIDIHNSPTRECRNILSGRLVYHEELENNCYKSRAF